MCRRALSDGPSGPDAKDTANPTRLNKNSSDHDSEVFGPTAGLCRNRGRVLLLLCTDDPTRGGSAAPEHAANRLDGIKVFGSPRGVDPTSPTAYIRDAGADLQSFLDVVSVSNAKAATRRDWDKKLGYYYILELTVPKAGEVKVGLRSVASPKAPFPTTATEMAAFRKNFSTGHRVFPTNRKHFISGRKRIARSWPRG